MADPTLRAMCEVAQLGNTTISPRFDSTAQPGVPGYAVQSRAKGIIMVYSGGILIRVNGTQRAVDRQEYNRLKSSVCEIETVGGQTGFNSTKFTGASMVYKVWSSANVFLGTVWADNDADAIKTAKRVTPCPMVRSEWLERNPLQG